MTSSVYNAFKKKSMEGSIALVTDTLKLMLVTSGYTPNIDTDDFINDVSANEVSNAGYTAGGATLASKAITIDTGNDRAYLDADDVSWTASVAPLTARYAVLYKDSGNPATSPVIGYIDFVTDRTVAVGDVFVIQWAAPGSGAILYLA